MILRHHDLIVRPGRTPAFVAVVVGVIMLVTGAGCMGHRDRSTFTSLPHRPVTLQVVEAYTDDVLWEYRIPVGHQLRVTMTRRGQDETGFTKMHLIPADRISWRLTTAGRFTTISPLDQGEHELPGTSVRLVTSVRQTPEFAPDRVPMAFHDATPEHIEGRTRPVGRPTDPDAAETPRPVIRDRPTEPMPEEPRPDVDPELLQPEEMQPRIPENGVEQPEPEERGEGLPPLELD
ncbi:MAG: hypothetical protein JJU36_08245 [Phycisphaeraceae bacterium]|nr:hypothetical protein [Phycisphaeraceae bacterium]